MFGNNINFMIIPPGDGPICAAPVVVNGKLPWSELETL
jgi:hypothetical protein